MDSRPIHLPNGTLAHRERLGLSPFGAPARTSLGQRHLSIQRKWAPRTLSGVSNPRRELPSPAHPPLRTSHTLGPRFQNALISAQAAIVWLETCHAPPHGSRFLTNLAHHRRAILPLVRPGDALPSLGRESSLQAYSYVCIPYYRMPQE